jgi:hypothetical protein
MLLSAIGDQVFRGGGASTVVRKKGMRGTRCGRDLHREQWWSESHKLIAPHAQISYLEITSFLSPCSSNFPIERQCSRQMMEKSVRKARAVGNGRRCCITLPCTPPWRLGEYQIDKRSSFLLLRRCYSRSIRSTLHGGILAPPNCVMRVRALKFVTSLAGYILHEFFDVTHMTR